MTTHLPKLLSRSAALALLALACLATWHTAIAPLLADRLGARDRITSERVMLGRLHAAEAELTQRIKAHKAPDANVTLAGASEAVALQALQASVTALAAQHGVRPQTTRMLPAVERGGLQLAGVQIELAAPLPSIQAVMHAVESARPMLLIEHLTLEPIPALARSAGAEEGALRASLHVYGVLPRRKE